MTPMYKIYIKDIRSSDSNIESMWEDDVKEAGGIWSPRGKYGAVVCFSNKQSHNKYVKILKDRWGIKRKILK